MQVVHIFPEKAHHWKGTSGASHGLRVPKLNQDPDRKRGLTTEHLTVPDIDEVRVVARIAK
ncbi:hypothetical protein NC651_039222 [Populus alba x Populus x berolinensis]|nr:hypothetical protein NC651_039222 [Populus alba x Populus x berolinensis]